VIESERDSSAGKWCTEIGRQEKGPIAEWKAEPAKRVSAKLTSATPTSIGPKQDRQGDVPKGGDSGGVDRPMQCARGDAIVPVLQFDGEWGKRVQPFDEERMTKEATFVG
jgi:hypothetical protein